MSYKRTAWSNPKPGTQVATLRDALIAGAIDGADWALYFHKSQRSFCGAIHYLENECGYIVDSWPSPKRAWQDHAAARCWRITGRIDFHGGGVAEDYTIPKEVMA